VCKDTQVFVEGVQMVCLLCVCVKHLLFIYFSALVWGSSVKHNPQRVGREHILNDEDVVQVLKKYVYFVFNLVHVLLLLQGLIHKLMALQFVAICLFLFNC
jgi:hypothetical protein